MEQMMEMIRAMQALQIESSVEFHFTHREGEREYACTLRDNQDAMEARIVFPQHIWGEDRLARARELAQRLNGEQHVGTFEVDADSGTASFRAARLHNADGSAVSEADVKALLELSLSTAKRCAEDFDLYPSRMTAREKIRDFLGLV